MNVTNKLIFNAADASVTQTSAAFSVNQVFGYSAQFVFTGSPVGTLKIQYSDDPGSLAPGDAMNVTNWTDVDNSSESVTMSGTAGYNVYDVGYNWIRFVYTASSGSGTISGRVNMKGA